MSRILLATVGAGSSPDERLNLVIIGLFVLAAVILVVSVLYWWATKPTRRARGDGPTNV